LALRARIASWLADVAVSTGDVGHRSDFQEAAMTRWLTLPAMTVLCAICTGCGPSQSAGTTGTGDPAANLRTGGPAANLQGQSIPSTPTCDTDAQTFIDQKVRRITNFHSEKNGDYSITKKSNYVPPTFSGQALDTSMTTVFTDAYQQMSQHDKTFLCTKIDYIFVDDDSNAPPYAFWETDYQYKSIPPGTIPLDPPHQKPWRFIGIPTWFFSQNQTFDTYEATNITNLTTTKSNPTGVTVKFETTFAGGQPNNSALLLGLLGHEAGLIVWQFVPDISCTYQSTNDPFSVNSWKHYSDTPHDHGEPFHFFGHKIGSNSRKNDPPPDGITNAAVLKALYLNGRFASVLATAAPDDDFAETFKFHFLTGPLNPALQNIWITFPDGRIDVLPYLTQGKENARKLACASQMELRVP
jgi:hypothetical protein